MLQPGSAAPAFALRSDTGDVVQLQDLKGRKVVLYFYPKDDTPGCTVQACEFRDHWAAVKRSGAVVLGVSPDRVESHQKFKRKYELPFPLLADPDHAVAESFGVWGEKSFMGRKYQGIHRTTFLIDESGRIARVFENVKPKGHAELILEAL